MNILEELGNTPSQRELKKNAEATGVIYTGITQKALVNLGCFPLPSPQYDSLYVQDRKLRDLKANYPLGQYCDVDRVIRVLAIVIFASCVCVAGAFALSGMPLCALIAFISGTAVLAMGQTLKYNSESNPQSASNPQNFSQLRNQLNSDISQTEIWLDGCIQKNQEIALENEQKQAAIEFIDSMRRFLDNLSKE